MARPNVLFLMSDQHHAGALGCAGNQSVATPTLDRLAERGVRFSHAYCNNPICCPSRVSFHTGQYPHTHGMLGNYVYSFPDPNHDTLAAVFRRHGYQTALVGKSHMTRVWDEEGFEHIRYCDMIDAEPDDLLTNHCFRHLVEAGMADLFDTGTLPSNHPVHRQGFFTSAIPLAHSTEVWTGDETIKFLRGRDRDRPVASACASP